MNARGTALALIRRWHDSARFADWPSERVLAQYVSAREEAAFCELLHRHAGHVWAVCQRELSRTDLAEDAFQATFLTLIRKGHQIREPGALVAWLDRVARRSAGAIRKKESRRAAAEAKMPARDGDAAVIQPREVSVVVRAAVDALPDKYRLPITYRYLVGLAPAEVARVMGLNEDTGKTRLKRGLQLLRDNLGGKGLGIGVAATTGTVSLESALTAAAERVPDGVLLATLDAVRALPVKRSLLAALLGVVTFRRGMIAGWTVAAGMATALVLMPDSKPRLLRVSSNTTPDKGPTMRGTSIFATAVALMLAPKAPAQSFTRIVDTMTPIPNGSGNFANFNIVPVGVTSAQNLVSVSGTTVTFPGQGTGGQLGIYTATVQGTALARIMDLNTPIPGGVGNFTGLNNSLSSSGSTAVFSGIGTGGYQGVFAGSSNATLVRVVDTNTLIPGGTGNYLAMPQNTGSIYTSDSTVAFNGVGDNNQNGIYIGTITGGPLVMIANTFATIPNTNNTFTGFSYLSVTGNTVAFRGQAGNGAGVPGGVYTSPITGGPLTVMADVQTPVPNGSGATFTGFGFLSSFNSKVSFYALYNGGGGIYVGSVSGGSLMTIVDSNTPIPGGTGNFTTLAPNSIGETTVAFLGGGSGGQKGIYSAPIGGGPITKIIAIGDTLDGKTVSNLDFGKQGNDTSHYAFTAIFTDGSSGIYVFTPVPEPTGLLPVSVAAAAGAFAVGRWLFRGF
jgi:RNA polymerase sigma factor (sigma-70 family)